MVKPGKLPWSTMSSLLSLLPFTDPDLIVGPAQGEDAAVIRFRDGFLVAHVDPITTGVRRAGYLAVHVAGNDVAVRGVRPRWFMPTVLLPPQYSVREIEELFRDMASALSEINGVVVGGHTEVTPGLERPIIVMAVAGYTTGRVITTRDAREGDYVLVVGRIAGEGAGVIAWDFEDMLLRRGVPVDVVEKAKGFISEVSVVETALAIKNYVNTMHDATEGGVLQAIREVAIASGKDIIVEREKFTIEREVEEIAGSMGVDPLKLLSSGCIVATTPPGNLPRLLGKLEELGVKHSIVGYVVEGSGRVIVESKSKGREVVDTDIIDEIYKLWSQ